MIRRVAATAVLALFVTLVASCGGSSSNGTTTLPAATGTRAGPTASVNPRSGPPGTEITISGSGWPAGVEVILSGGASGSAPYTTVLTDQSGSFRKSFFIEKQPTAQPLRPAAST